MSMRIRMMRIRISDNIISSTSFSLSPKSDLVYATAGVTSKGECVSDKAMIKLRSDEEKNHYDNIICRKSRKILMTRMILGFVGVLDMVIMMIYIL